MTKYLYFAALLLGVMLRLEPVYADMPFYDDDEEFKHCTKVTGNWDTCVKEETLRALNAVKQEYRSILGNQAILEWHAKPEENTAVLRDMYDSWTAFRNRLCMLSYKASMYIEPLVDERYSCNLYYTLHHKAHLAYILQLMGNTAPENRNDFHFLDLSSHDAEYETCIKSNDNSACINEELKRSSQAIKDIYKSFINDEYVGKWNNGPSLKQGNYRDMYDSWIAYRNRICSLAIWAYKRKYGDAAPSLEQCLQMFNREKLEAMENLLTVAHSSLDDGMEEEEDKSNGLGATSTAPTREDDGGEAIGKTIPPLQKRILSGSDRPEDELVVNYKQKSEEKPATPKDNRNIPAWAQQK